MALIIVVEGGDILLFLNLDCVPDESAGRDGVGRGAT